MNCQRVKGTASATETVKLLLSALLLFQVSEFALGHQWNHGQFDSHRPKKEYGFQKPMEDQNWGQPPNRQWEQSTKRNWEQPKKGNLEPLINTPFEKSAHQQSDNIGNRYWQQPENKQEWEHHGQVRMQEPADQIGKDKRLRGRMEQPASQHGWEQRLRDRVEETGTKDGFDGNQEQIMGRSAYQNGWEHRQREGRNERANRIPEFPTSQTFHQPASQQQEHVLEYVDPFVCSTDSRIASGRSEGFGESAPVGSIIEFKRNETITFVSSNKTPETINMTDWTNMSQLTHLVQLSPEFNPQRHFLLQGSFIKDKQKMLPSRGFVHTVLTAYKDHHNIILSPDDIWIAILVQFSRHVNANAEELRHFFVSHSGTLALSFEMDSLSGSAGNGGKLTKKEWRRILNTLRGKLDQKVNPEYSDFVRNNFSTSNEKERIASSAVFLSTMQHYFKYEVRVLCGIPRVTILGNEEDWMEIRRWVEILRRFGEIPEKWSDVLGPIIDQFIRAKQGDIDDEFWGDIVRIQKNKLCGGRSGVNGEKNEDILDGWLTAFAVFDGQGKWRGEKPEDWKWPRINLKYVSSGVVTVPITLKTLEMMGVEVVQDGTIFAGHMGFSADGKTLSPYVGWAVARSFVDLPNPVGDFISGANDTAENFGFY